MALSLSLSLFLTRIRYFAFFSQSTNLLCVISVQCFAFVYSTILWSQFFLFFFFSCLSLPLFPVSLILYLSLSQKGINCHLYIPSSIILPRFSFSTLSHSFSLFLSCSPTLSQSPFSSVEHRTAKQEKNNLCSYADESVSS